MATAAPAMVPDAHLDRLEQYLRRAGIVQVHSPVVEGGWRNKCRIVLDGGVTVMQKPLDGHNTDGKGDEPVHREAAAWTLSRAFGWTDLIATTVHRDMWCPLLQRDGLASVQILWPGPTLPLVPATELQDRDTWRAAILDVAMFNTDRSSANWISVAIDGDQPRIRLVDHGHCFSDAGQVSSPFFEMHRGKAMPAELTDCLPSALDRVQDLGLSSLIGAPAYDSLMERLKHLESSGELGVA